jgi:hypothetical protein
MKFLDPFHHLPYPTAERHRPRWIALMVVAAGVLFLLALVVGSMGFTITARLLGGVSGGAIGVAVLLAIMQTRWFWRVIRWHEQRPPRPKPQTLKEDLLRNGVIYLLIIFAVIMLVYNLLNSAY